MNCRVNTALDDLDVSSSLPTSLTFRTFLRICAGPIEMGHCHIPYVKKARLKALRNRFP